MKVNSKWQLVKSLYCDEVSRERGLGSVKTGCVSEMGRCDADVVFKFIEEVLLGVVIVTFVDCQGVEVSSVVKVVVALAVHVFCILV